MDVNNVNLTNFYYQGGDDCVAIKPRSYNVYVQNATCHGGNGMAIGSLGQYLEDSSAENIYMTDVNVSILSPNPVRSLSVGIFQSNTKPDHQLQ